MIVASAPPSLEFTGGAEPGERLAYRLDGDTLVRRATPRFAASGADAVAVPLLSGVASLGLAAFDGHAWRAEWDDTMPPPAVRLRLAFTDGEVLETVAPVPAGRPRKDG
jgi:hypothetical protein